MSATRLPLPYLATCSEMSLESVELSRLNRAANLRKEFHQILEDWIDSEVDARLARSLLEWKREQETVGGSQMAHAPAPAQFQQLAIAFLPESSAPATHETSECDAQSPRTDGRTNRAASASRTHSPAQLPKRDQAIAPSRSTHCAMAAETRLREVENLAECFSEKLRDNRRECAANRADARSGAGFAASGTKVSARAFRPIQARGSGTLEFVPLSAGRSETVASAPQPIRTEGAHTRHTLRTKLDKLEPQATTRPASPTPCALHLPTVRPTVRLRARQAI
jgi:hypothetical protein